MEGLLELGVDSCELENSGGLAVTIGVVPGPEVAPAGRLEGSEFNTGLVVILQQARIVPVQGKHRDVLAVHRQGQLPNVPVDFPYTRCLYSRLPAALQIEAGRVRMAKAIIAFALPFRRKEFTLALWGIS